jgi:hypothetical protein
VAVPAPADALPAEGAVAGWEREGQARVYDRETLFDFMNGAADLYFAYGFEELAVSQHVDAQGRAVQVEVYRTASDADAYGLFTYNSYGEPIDLGVDGELEGGRRLAFWQARTFVQVSARDEVDDKTLRAFGEAVASALPEGGQRPALVEALPAEGLEPGSVRFFRVKIALDNLLWLGADDVLGLGADTAGLVAHYQVDGQGIDLMLVAFPDPVRASEARAGLEGAGLEELLATDVVDDTLGAVFGPPGLDVAAELLGKAMAALP